MKIGNTVNMCVTMYMVANYDCTSIFVYVEHMLLTMLLLFND